MLKGKSALVTGSTRGIGLAIARALAAAGCDITLNGFGDSAEIESLRRAIEQEHGIRARYSGADMIKPAEIQNMIEDAVAALDGLDILVNNAGIRHVAPIEEFPLDKWDEIIAIDLSFGLPYDARGPAIDEGQGLAASSTSPRRMDLSRRPIRPPTSRLSMASSGSPRWSRWRWPSKPSPVTPSALGMYRRL